MADAHYSSASIVQRRREVALMPRLVDRVIADEHIADEKRDSGSTDGNQPSIVILGALRTARPSGHHGKPAGGPSDVLARLIGQKMTEDFGQPVPRARGESLTGRLIDGGLGRNNAGLVRNSPHEVWRQQHPNLLLRALRRK